MLNAKVMYYKHKLSKGEMCCVATKDDIKALKITLKYKKRKFNINTIIFQRNRIQKEKTR